jgi:competence protein ComFA
MKGERLMRYKGWISPPAMRDFHEGRIWLKNHAPFSVVDINKAINQKYFCLIEGIQMKPVLK